MEQSLAVKYRPTEFEDVCGQSEVKVILQNQWDSGEIKHAYLFCGGAGTGKTTCARIFANKINHGEGTPIELDAASNNSVDDVRDIIQDSKTASLDSEYKVYILDEVHALSNNAWQAMLKLLDEPPKKSIFIMCTTDPQKIPKTILSRVQRFQFQRISQREIVERLHYICEEEDIKVPEIPVDTEYSHALEYIAKLADGGMRDAITMLDKCIAYSTEITLSNVLEALGVEDYHTFHELTGALIDKNEEMTIRIIESVHSEGKDLKTFMRDYTNFLLDLCKFDVTRSYEFIQIPTTENLSEKYNADDFWYFRDLLSVCIKLNERIKWDSSPKSMIEATLFLECNRGAE